MREYDIYDAVDVVIAYHRDVVRAIAGGVGFEEYERLSAKSEAARELLRLFGEVLEERDRDAYFERLRVRLDAVAELVFFKRSEGPKG